MRSGWPTTPVSGELVLQPDGSLEPDYTGIRPKIYAKGEPARDFYIQCSDVHGIASLINLYGIESPGLTSAIAIGDYVLERASRVAGRARRRSMRRAAPARCCIWKLPGT